MALSWNDFEMVDMRVGTIKRVEEFPKARTPAYKVWIDFGPEIGTLKSSAQITDHYLPKDLLDRQVIAVINFPRKQIADFMSECLILGAPTPEGVVLLEPGMRVSNGLRIE